MKDVVFKTIMLKGEAGGTIAGIQKTGTSGLVDTYTITLSDGTTQTFEVTNGSGIVSIEKTSTAGLIDTYTITYENGDTDTFEITNGSNGSPGYEVPAGSVIYYDNDDTPQGYEPTTNPDLGDFQTPLAKGQVGTSSNTIDFDSYAGENSVYFINCGYSSNGPLTSGYVFLENISASSTLTLQRATRYLSTGAGDSYIRAYGNNRWSPWTKVTQAIT